MDLFITTFESVGALLGIGFLGFLVISRKLLPEKALGFLSPLALDIALPSLVFVNILVKFQPADFPGWWTLPLWWLGFTVFLAAMTGVFMFLSKKAVRREFAVSLFFQNALFFPLAIITGLYGEGSELLISLFFFVLFFPSFLFSTAHLFFNTAGAKIRWDRILNNVLLATLLATTIRLTGLYSRVPGFLVDAVQMVGHMALPLLMIILGGSVYVDFKGQGKLYPWETVKFVLIKNIVFPFITMGVLLLVRPGFELALLMLIESCVPPVTAVPILVERAGGNRHLVNQFMFSSFVFSLLSIPLCISLFLFYYPAG